MPVLPGSVTKCYHFSLTDATQGRREKLHKIMLRHNQITGSRYVILDGLEIPGSRGRTAIVSAVEIGFKVDNENAMVTITPNLSGGGFAYTCTVGSRSLEELSQVLAPEEGMALAPKKVKVPETLMHSSEGKLVVNYKVVTTVAPPGGGGGGDENEWQESTSYRRYSEFEKLDRLLKSAFAGSHLLSSLPSLPGKVYNPFTNQTDPSFIENRRRELEVYMTKLVNFAKAKTNADLLKFMGLDPVTGLPLDPMEADKYMECRF